MAGGLVSLAFMSWVAIGSQLAIASKRIIFPRMPVSVEGCTYDFLRENSTFSSAHIPRYLNVLIIDNKWYPSAGRISRLNTSSQPP